MHKSGFVNIIGNPNVGKSTLVNSILNEKIAIVSKKEQTTRHRIFAILNNENYQIVFSDTPGFIEPKYELQKKLVSAANSALNDADLFFWVVDVLDKNINFSLLEKIKKKKIPIFLILNKIDLVKSEQEKKLLENFWKENTQINEKNIYKLSAKNDKNFEKIIFDILEIIPEHPAFFPKEMITDKNERFYVSEIIRQKIFENYFEEIPYCSQVEIEKFEEKENIINISTVIHVEKNSQKAIIIGKNASAIKKISTESRLELEIFFCKKIFLTQFVKVSENWRNSKNKLKEFGYE
jgi:GTP-binding protein Era